MTHITGTARDQHAFDIRIHSTPFAVHECNVDCKLWMEPRPSAHRDAGKATAAIFVCYAACSDPIGMVKAAVTASLWNIATVSSE